MTNYVDAKGISINIGDKVLCKHLEYSAPDYERELKQQVFEITSMRADGAHVMYPVVVRRVSGPKALVGSSDVDMFEFNAVLKVPVQFAEDEQKLKLFRELAGW